jgi:hypothetical protein
MGGWLGGWMEGKAGLRIAYSNQKLIKGGIAVLFKESRVNNTFLCGKISQK